MRVRAAVLSLLLLALASVSVPSVADAGSGTYTIRSCGADRGAYSSRAFIDSASKGMRIRRACAPRGSGLRGMVVGNVPKRKTVVRGSRAAMSIIAAPGTVFRRVTWLGSASRSDCAYALQLYAAKPGGHLQSLMRSRRSANVNCPRRGTQALTSANFGSTSNIAGANRITQRVVCLPKGDRRTCSARGANYVQLRRVEVTVQDIQPPSVRITGGSLFQSPWVSGERTVTYAGSDNVGLQSARVLVLGGAGQGKLRPCNNALVIPCPNGGDELPLATDRLGEGTQQIRVEATDGAGLVAQSPPLVARIDNTAPGAVPVSIAEGAAWRAANGFNATWANPLEPDRAPIVGAYYRLCRAGGACEDRKAVLGMGVNKVDGFQVPGPGEWTFRMWRQDQAGNTDPVDASTPVTVRYDPEAPQLVLDPVNPTDPTLLTAAISDPLSGAASGQIEISRVGSGTWQNLPTQLEGGRLKARIDDASLAPGRYALRAGGVDRAGNRAQTDRRSDGAQALVDLPLRTGAALSAGFVRHRTVRRAVRRNGKRKVIRRRVVRLASRVHVKRGERASVTGRMTTTDGRSVPNSLLYVFSAQPGGGTGLAGVIRTDAIGRYRYGFRADASLAIKIAYPGGASILPVSRDVSVIVPAQTTLVASRHRIANGQRVVFGGRLAVPPVRVAAGKLVELQTKLSGKWQTFRTVRTDARGHWRSAYRFRRTRGTVRYAFRARLPTEAGYPFGVGTSRFTRVTVRGR